MDSPPLESTEQLRAEVQRLRAQLAAASQQTQPIWLNTISDAIVLTDADLNIQEWNDAAERIYGWPRAMVIGRPITEIVSAINAGQGEHFAAITQSIVATDTWHDVFAQQTRDGREVTLEISISRLTT